MVPRFDLMMVSAFACVAAVYMAVSPPLNRNQTMWLGFGLFLAVMTATRPWWFWEHYKARALRRRIGDGAVVVIYLAIAFAMIWVGLYTDWTFGRR